MMWLKHSNIIELEELMDYKIACPFQQKAKLCYKKRKRIVLQNKVAFSYLGK